MPTLRYWFAAKDRGSIRVTGANCDDVNELGRASVVHIYPDLHRPGKDGAVFDTEGVSWTLEGPNEAWFFDEPFEVQAWKRKLGL